MRKSLQNNYCVIGDPIGHSLSPDIHTKVFDILKIDAAYTKEHVAFENLAAFVKETRDHKRPGFNVTIPHKENIIPLLDEIDEFAARIGAVNTVWNNGGQLIGYNTDVIGCRTALQHGGWSSGASVVMIGAGGAARAVLSALSTMNVQNVLLYDIDPGRCDLLVNHFSDLRMNLSVADDWCLVESQAPASSLLVNASPVGMWPNVDKTPFSRSDLFWEGMAVFDLVPKPLHTRLLKEARDQGALIIPGLSMLVAQALAADEIWLEQRLPAGTFETILEHLMEIISES